MGLAAVVLSVSGATHLPAQRGPGTLVASATVVAHPATMRALGRPAGATALEATAGAWRLSGRPGAAVGVKFDLPDRLTATRGASLLLATRRATGQWQRPGDVSTRRFDAEMGTTVLIGSADDPSAVVAFGWTPRPAGPAAPGSYMGSLVMTLAYY